MALSRRAFLGGAGALAVAGGAGIAGAGYVEGWLPESRHLHRLLGDTGRNGTIPDAPEGVVRYERRSSRSRNRDVGLFTAVPAGHGAGRGLPVCLVLHGATATTRDFRRFGLARFLTAAVRAGVPPFVLVGADGGTNGWQSSDDADVDDPQGMLIDEVPQWLARDGFDFDRLGAWGWSMGGHGALLLAEALGTRLRAAAAFSPAVPSSPDGRPPTRDHRPRDVWAAIDRLDGPRTGLWCGTADDLYPRVRRFAGHMPEAPAVAAWTKGAHTRGYWNRITPDAFRFVGARLS